MNEKQAIASIMRACETCRETLKATELEPSAFSLFVKSCRDETIEELRRTINAMETVLSYTTSNKEGRDKHNG